MAAVCCRHPDYDPEGGRALLGVRRAILGELGSDRQERKLRRRTGAANDAGNGTGQQDKEIDGKVRGRGRDASGDVAGEALRL